MEREIKLKHILSFLGLLIPVFILMFTWINKVSNNQVLFESKIKAFEVTLRSSIDSHAKVNRELNVTLNKLNITLTSLKTEVDIRNEVKK